MSSITTEERVLTIEQRIAALERFVVEQGYVRSPSVGSSWIPKPDPPRPPCLNCKKSYAECECDVCFGCGRTDCKGAMWCDR